MQKVLLMLAVLSLALSGCSGSEETVGDAAKTSTSDVDVQTGGNQKAFSVGTGNAPAAQGASSDGLK